MTGKALSPGEFEFRIVWKREDQPRRRKIYQTRQGAEEFRALLTGTNPEEDWYGREHPGDDALERETYERQHAAFVEEPKLEVRPVGVWR